MKNRMHQVIRGGLAGILCVAGTLLWSGCDTASSTEELVISPAAATLSSGQSQTFTVSGGYHYTWSITGTGSSSGSTSSAQGSLSSLTGSEVVYTAPSSAALSGSVTLNVTSTIEGTASGTSNSPAYSVTGTAVINFKSADSNPLIIDPSLTTLAIGGTKDFTVSGGAAPYKWGVSDTGKGQITEIKSGTKIATYKALASGAVTITCDDASGNQATASVNTP